MRTLALGAALCALAGCALDRSVLVIDRIEDDVAVVVDARGGLWTTPLEALPEGVGEGDALVDGALDDAERAAREDEVRSLRHRLRGPLEEESPEEEETLSLMREGR